MCRLVIGKRVCAVRTGGGYGAFLLLRELPADMKRLLCHPGPDTDRVVPAVQCADIFFSQSPNRHFSLPGSVTIFQAVWINVLTFSL